MIHQSDTILVTQMDDDSRTAIGIIILIVNLVTIIFNVTVAAAFYREPKVRVPISNYYILNLCVTDLLTAFFCVPLYSTTLLIGKWSFGFEFCVIFIIIDSCCRMETTLMLVVITYERYLMAMQPLNITRNTLSKVLKNILVSWICTFIMRVPAIIYGEVYHVHKLNASSCSLDNKMESPFRIGKPTYDKIYLSFSVFIELAVPLTLIFYWNLKIYLLLHRRCARVLAELPAYVAGANDKVEKSTTESVDVRDKTICKNIERSPCNDRLQLFTVENAQQYYDEDAGKNHMTTPSTEKNAKETEKNNTNESPNDVYMETDHNNVQFLQEDYCDETIHQNIHVSTYNKSTDHLTPASIRNTADLSHDKEVGDVDNDTRDHKASTANKTTSQDISSFQNSAINFKHELQIRKKTIKTSLQANPPLRSKYSIIRRRTRRSARLLLVMTAVFIIFRVPYSVILIIASTCWSCIQGGKYEAGFWIEWTMSMTNPILYALICSPFKQFCKTMLQNLRATLLENNKIFSN